MIVPLIKIDLSFKVESLAFRAPKFADIIREMYHSFFESADLEVRPIEIQVLLEIAYYFLHLLLSRNSRNGLVCPIEPIQLIVLTSMQPVGQSSIA